MSSSSPQLDNLTVSDQAGYVRVAFAGVFSFKAAQGCVDVIASESQQREQRRVLFDCRGMSGRMSVLDRFRVAIYGQKFRRLGLRIAMLGRSDQILPGNFFENVARNRGINVRVFRDEKLALGWLTASEAPASA